MKIPPRDMAYYWLYPTTTSSSNPTSSTRQYSPGLLNYYHSSQHSNYLNPVNNYYLQYQNQYRYRWPVNYGYNYIQSAPYTYDYGNTSVNESAFYRAKSPTDTKSIKSRKIKYEKVKPDEGHKMKPSLNSAKKSTNQERATKNEHKIIKKIDEQKNKENIKMQLISQLTNQTQIELNKLIELKNKRRQITYLGIVTANPSDYVKKYGKVLIEPVKEQTVKEKLPVLEVFFQSFFFNDKLNVLLMKTK